MSIKCVESVVSDCVTSVGMGDSIPWVEAGKSENYLTILLMKWFQ